MTASARVSVLSTHAGDAIEWIVFYADGSSFTNLDGGPERAPRSDALCIAAYSKDHGRMIWHGTDYFIWETQWGEGCGNGEWVSVDREGLSDYLDRPGATKIRIRGRHVPPGVFWSLYERANSDPRLPPRSSYDPRERRP